MDTKQSTPLITSTEFTVITPLVEWADTFLRAKQAEQVSRNTIHFYGANLKNFLSWCDSQFVRTVEELTADHLRMFLLRLKETGHNPGGIHGHYRTIRTFLRWYAVEVEPEGWRNPCERVKAPRLVDEPLAAVSLEDVERLFKAASGNMASRDQAAVLVLADSGLRAAEFLALNIDDIDGFTGEIRVKHGKGKKSRTVFIGKRTRRALRSWLKQHDTGAALFTSDEGTRLTYSGLRQTVRRLSVKAGIPYPPIHSFRRCFAINFLRSGGDLLSLQRLLGHSDLSLLGRYAKQNTDDLAIAHSAHSPVDRLGE
jgi:site-specific recombinase XerD